MLGEGVHTISASDYHSNKDMPGVMLSASILKILLDQSPAHARLAHSQLNPDYVAEEHAKFDLGTAFHDLFLEGIDKVDVIDAKDWRTNAAKEARDASYAAGRIPLLKHQVADVVAMSAAVEQQLDEHQDCPGCFADGVPQQTLIWQEGGIWCKAMLDWRPNNSIIFTDLKSTSVSANPADWIRGPFFSTGCDIQAAWYLRGIRKALGIKGPLTFQFCVVETTPPYALSIVAVGEAVLTLANQKIDHALAVWSVCLESGKWPAYAPLTAWAELPEHLARRWEERKIADGSREDIERYYGI